MAANRVNPSRPCDENSRNPIWKGPIPGWWYYMIRNKEIRSGTWEVPYSGDPQYEDHVYQIDVHAGGRWSLIESDIPLPIKPEEGRLLVHGEVQALKEKLKESHDKNVDSGEKDEEGNPVYVNQPGTPVKEEDLFGVKEVGI